MMSEDAIRERLRIVNGMCKRLPDRFRGAYELEINVLTYVLEELE